MADVTRNDKDDPTGGAVAWRMRSGGEFGSGWILTESQQLADEMRSLGWEVQALGVIPHGVALPDGGQR